MHRIKTILLVALALPSIVFGSTMTFYPDPSSGATTVDCRITGNAVTWSGVRGLSSSSDINTTETGQAIRTYKENIASWYLYRWIWTFDTSALPDDAIITSATLSLYQNNTGETKVSDDTDSIDIVSSAPSTNNNCTGTDYATLGTTAFGSIAISALTTNAYNDFSLNSGGIANISLSGISKFGGKTELDRANTTPTGNNLSWFYTADQTGTDKDPVLTVVYTTGGGGGGSGTSTVSIASTTPATLSDIAFGLAIIIVILSLGLVAMIGNSISNRKKPWQK